MSPRTGCTAIADGVLIPRFGGEYCPPEDVFAPDGTRTVRAKHSTVPELVDGGVLTQREVDDLFVFSTVRNPFDSLVSLYKKQAGRYQDTDSWDFLQHDPRQLENTRFAADHDFPEWVEYVIRPRNPREWVRVAKYRRWPPPRFMFESFVAGVDFVMRYENLQADLTAALAEVGIDGDTEIPQINVTSERTESDYRSFYDDKTRALVEKAYADDIQRWGYSF